MTRYNMQRYYRYVLIFLIGQLFLGCNPDDLEELEKYGYISLSPSAEFDELLYDNITVTVYDEDSVLVVFYESISGAPEQIELPVGNYYLIVKSNALLEGALGVEIYLESGLFSVSQDLTFTISLPLEAVAIPPEEGEFIPEMRRFIKALGGPSNDVAFDAIELSTDGYVAVGYTRSAGGDVSNYIGGSFDFWVVKLDFDGELVWEKTFGGSSTEIAHSVAEAIDGSGYVIAGYSSSSNGDLTGNNGNNDYWIIKVDPDGNLLWQKNYGGSSLDRAEEVIATSDGGYIINGRTASGNIDVVGYNGGNDFWVIKLDANGNLEWQHPLGGSSTELGYGITETSDGGYAACGYSRSTNGDVSTNNGGTDFWIVKLSSTGSIQWESSYGGTSTDIAYGIGQDDDGNYLVGGITRSNNTGDVTGFNGGTDDFWGIKLNSTGGLIWQKTVGGSNRDIALGARSDRDGNLLIQGYSRSSDGDRVNTTYGGWDMWTTRLDGDGNLDWEVSHGGSSTDIGYSVFQARDRGYILSGYSRTANGVVPNNNGGVDFFLVKVDTEGSFTE